MTGEVVLFKGRGGKDGFGIEEARELGDESFALFQDVLNLRFCLLLFFRGFFCNVGGGRELRVCVEESVRLYFVSLCVDEGNIVQRVPGFLKNVPADGAVPSPSLLKRTLLI